MAIQPLNPSDTYYDLVLNAVLEANGTLSAYNSHEMTMLWPTYTAIDIADSAVARLIPATYDHWTNIVEYYDASLCMTVKIDLNTGKQSSATGVSQTTPQSQQNKGWSVKVEDKKTETKKIPFSVGSILFHKPNRTKWVFSEIDNITNHPVLRSFYDKSQAMQIFERDYEEFEEIFF